MQVLVQFVETALLDDQGRPARVAVGRSAFDEADIRMFGKVQPRSAGRTVAVEPKGVAVNIHKDIL